MNDSDYKAIEIAVDELRSYVDVVRNVGSDEAKLDWAIRKLDAILLRRPSHPDSNYTSRVSAEKRAGVSECDGSKFCTATTHIHGCFAGVSE